MKELVKGGAALIFLSFFIAFVHSCSMDNGILRPACLVSEMDLDRKWWYPQNNAGEPALYFQPNGLIRIEGQTDSLSFVLENCNKIRVTNYTQNYQEQWVIKNISDMNLSIEYPQKLLVEYSRVQ